MFDRIRILLGPHEGPIGRLVQASAPAPAVQPRTTHEGGFGDRMRREHAALRDTLRSVLDGHCRRDFVSCLAHLRRFDRMLQQYLANHDARLEAHIMAQAVTESERLQSLRTLRARLRHLARQAHELAGLRPSDLHPPCRQDFGLAFLGMSKSLRDSLDGFEARLLPLYRAEDGADDGAVKSGAA